MAESSGKTVTNNVNSAAETQAAEPGEAADDSAPVTVMEVMLLEEYRHDHVPQSLQNLFGYFQQQNINVNKFDLVVSFIYVLMLETGFVPAGFEVPQADYTVSCDFHYKRMLAASKAMPEGWRQGTFYSLSFMLAPYPTNVCTVTCVVTGEDLVVNCSLRGEDFTILLDASCYIVNCGMYGIGGIYQNLRDLSIKFKSTISYPCKIRILQHCGVVRSASFIGLPPELSSYINKLAKKTYAKQRSVRVWTV